MLKTRFTELVGCQAPIQQAGMGGVATVELAAAVADAGGLGMIGAVRLPAAFLTATLEQLRRQTRGVFGVNFLMPFLDRDCVSIAAARSRVVEFFYDRPDAVLVKQVHDGGALACWQIGSRDEAVQAVDAGCDFIVAQGVEAGGHVRGKIGLLPLLDQVLNAVSVPVVAAGGIASPRSMAAALAAGAAGVRIGTLFVTAAESIAHADYKQALIEARPEDTVLTDAYSANWPNAPHRVLRSCIAAAAQLPEGIVGETALGGSAMPIPRFTTPPPLTTTTGHVEAMALYAGESVGAINAIWPAAQIIGDLVEGTRRRLAGS
jgi:NAD(P)H-dependent flavin oxidoreductase YrpB (nitropropane dioxygenase family)